MLASSHFFPLEDPRLRGPAPATVQIHPAIAAHARGPLRCPAHMGLPARRTGPMPLSSPRLRAPRIRPGSPRVPPSSRRVRPPQQVIRRYVKMIGQHDQPLYRWKSLSFFIRVDGITRNSDLFPQFVLRKSTFFSKQFQPLCKFFHIDPFTS